jgi:hypothetical protein
MPQHPPGVLLDEEKIKFWALCSDQKRSPIIWKNLMNLKETVINVS